MLPGPILVNDIVFYISGIIYDLNLLIENFNALYTDGLNMFDQDDIIKKGYLYSISESGDYTTAVRKIHVSP